MEKKPDKEKTEKRPEERKDTLFFSHEKEKQKEVKTPAEIKAEVKETKPDEGEVLKTYRIEVDNVKATIRIVRRSGDYVPNYEVEYPKMMEATSIVLDTIREQLIEKVVINPRDILNQKMMEGVKQRFMQKAVEIIERAFPTMEKGRVESIGGSLIHEMLGLGIIEILISDADLEELVINSSDEPIWVYHKQFGWLKSNITPKSEDETYNYASIIGRKVGRQITTLDPLMDAHLTTGDRVNATLSPISSRGNTITIRKFSRNPWTITHLIDPKINTLNAEVGAFLWLCMEYELSLIMAGGTGSGKTTFLNSILPFVPPNQRIISIEDTRELNLPRFLHWVPMTTRQPNPEGKGEVTMLDLVVNSLRMRPDRIIVGEIRRQREAEVLFEAMHTGHSVYSTLHANTAEQVKRRMTSPPISLPESMLEALHVVCVQFRDRRRGTRRTFQLAEVVPIAGREGVAMVDLNVLYVWRASEDKLVKIRTSQRVYEEIMLHAGMQEKEIEEDLKQKMDILNWLVTNKINTVNTVGKVLADYYKGKDEVLQWVSKNKKPLDIFPETLLNELNR